MKTAVASLQLWQPKRLNEALRLMSEQVPLTPLAGGTDLYVTLNAGSCPARRFLDLSRISELRGIQAARGGGLVLGACTTFAEIRGSAVVRKRLPALASAASEIGGAQIQNRATLAGNLANASPAADSVPVLLAAEARLVLGSLSGQRTVPAAEFFLAYRKTALAPDELILRVEIPALDGVSWFRKVGTRAANAISKVVFAGVRKASPCIALGSVGPIPLRARATEAALAEGAGIEVAAERLLQEISPIDDLRSTAEYRRFVSTALLRQFWDETAPRVPRRRTRP